MARPRAFDPGSLFTQTAIRIVFHIDVNSAFLSWTAVKLVREGQPDIRLVPSVVSGDPDDRRSIIAAASIPAKKLGIRAAQPVSMALRKYPQLVIVRGDWHWYKQCSDAFIAICRRYSPVLQQFSIDECFLDMTLRCGGHDPAEVAARLKDEVKSRLGFTVNVGVGPNKLLAKMASDFEKPDKVHTLWGHEVPEKMWPLPVRDLLWVGRKTEERLVAYGINTIGDLARLEAGQLTRLVGRKFAQQLHDNANGRDDSPVETEVAEAKSYSAERTFKGDLSDPKALDRELFNVACIVAHRIRRDSFRASTISITVKYRDFTVAQKQCHVAQPTDVTAVILNEARRMLSEIWDGVTPLRLVGLGVSKLTHESVVQMSLFEDPKMEYYREWDRQYDEQRALAEDARLLAYERKHNQTASTEIQTASTVSPVSSSATASTNDPLIFRHPDGESALAAAKKAIKEHPTYRFQRRKIAGTATATAIITGISSIAETTDCFEILDGQTVIERHLICSSTT